MSGKSFMRVAFFRRRGTVTDSRVYAGRLPAVAGVALAAGMLLFFVALIILAVLFAGVLVAAALGVGVAFAAIKAVGRWRRKATLQLPFGQSPAKLPHNDPPRIGNIGPPAEHPDE
jgi:hypothetical protein